MNDLIATVAATLFSVAVLAWLLTAVYSLGVVFGHPWMMGHGLVNDCLLIGGLCMAGLVDVCGWHIVRDAIRRYLDSLVPAGGSDR